jgi:hypothetical protein
MADWTNIPDATFNQDRPVLGSTHLAIVRNFTALANGASGAPRVQDASLSSTVTNAGRDWVLARTAISDAGAVGTYAFLEDVRNDANNYEPGTTHAGSNLRYSNGLRVGSSATPGGTWRVMGRAVSVVADAGPPEVRSHAPTLYLRIS